MERLYSARHSRILVLRPPMVGPSNNEKPILCAKPYVISAVGVDTLLFIG